MIISFSLTEKLAATQQVPDPLLTGIKTVTRRNWSAKTANTVCQLYDAGKIEHQAWSNCPFVPGAKRKGTILLTCKPYQETLVDMPDADLYHEGNLWRDKNEFMFTVKANLDTKLWVVRFKFEGIDHD